MEEKDMYFNQITIVGSVGKDPTVNEKVGFFDIACNRRVKRNNEMVERATWFRVVFFDEFHRNLVSNYIKRGTKVLINGVLEEITYSKDDGTQGRSLQIDISFGGKILVFSGSAEKKDTIVDDDIPF